MINQDIINEIIWLNNRIKNCHETITISKQRKEHLLGLYNDYNNTEFKDFDSLQFHNNNGEMKQ